MTESWKKLKNWREERSAGRRKQAMIEEEVRPVARVTTAVCKAETRSAATFYSTITNIEGENMRKKKRKVTFIEILENLEQRGTKKNRTRITVSLSTIIYLAILLVISNVVTTTTTSLSSSSDSSSNSFATPPPQLDIEGKFISAKVDLFVESTFASGSLCFVHRSIDETQPSEREKLLISMITFEDLKLG